MKGILILLSIATLAWLTSCTKTMSAGHDIHDTIYLTRTTTDTFRVVIIKQDTVIKHDEHTDTIVQKILDTVFIRTTRIDTLYQFYYDTAYLTKVSHDTVISYIIKNVHDTIINNVYERDTVVKYLTVVQQIHDTVTKNTYLHDTVNNYITVFKHDTVIQVNTITVVDTLFQWGGSITNAYNPGDSTGMYLTFGVNQPTAQYTDITFNDMTTYDPATYSYKRSFHIKLDTTGARTGDGKLIKYPSYPLFGITVTITDSVNGVSGILWIYAFENEETRSGRFRYEGYDPVKTGGFGYLYPGEFIKMEFQ